MGGTFIILYVKIWCCHTKKAAHMELTSTVSELGIPYMGVGFPIPQNLPIPYMGELFCTPHIFYTCFKLFFWVFWLSFIFIPFHSVFALINQKWSKY